MKRATTIDEQIESIHDIEVNLRTKVIYYVSNEYKNDPVWFVNNDIVMGTFIDYFTELSQVKIHKRDLT